MLYRLFPATPGASPTEPGGALYVPRLDQGRGRHDNPDVFGAMYFSRELVSPIAEYLKDLLGQRLDPSHLRSEGFPRAIAAVNESDVTGIVDLDDPANLEARALRPSIVATRDRRTTQSIATRVWEEGASGLEWWSTIEASWINVTLFAERTVDRLVVVDEPEVLTSDHPAVVQAARMVGLEVPG
ncbi:MAG: RES domain-containing protein [Actinomycetota bacterium]|nr:RES domain-containing protein [Actinomycetota bacterium]